MDTCLHEVHLSCLKNLNEISKSKYGYILRNKESETLCNFCKVLHNSYVPLDYGVYDNINSIYIYGDI